MSNHHIELARAYLAAIETGNSEADQDRFFAPDVIQEEFPNRLVPNGARRTLADLREAARRGNKAVTSQHYEVVNALASGNSVALEVIWTAVLAVPLGSIPAGGQMRARFAVFLEFRDDKIVAQHNYDCFDPF